MMTGGGGKVARQGNDFYPTPAAVTRALIGAERRALFDACDIANPVWEPCGRGGAITAEMEAAGFRTIATDLIADPAHREIGRASCRERVCQYVLISVVAVSLKKKYN